MQAFSNKNKPEVKDISFKRQTNIKFKAQKIKKET